MYTEKIQEKGYDMPNSIKRPELSVIIEKLQDIVTRYDGIVCETHQKLKMIKKYEESSILKEDQIEKNPESFIEEINRLLVILNSLNDAAEINLRHLREIV